MNDDGTMARRARSRSRYCERHGLKMITVADLIEYRRQHDKLVQRTVSAACHEYGVFRPSRMRRC